MSTVQEKIDGLIALYRNAASFPNEKNQAYKALVRLCEKNGLNLDDVLQTEQKPQDYVMNIRNLEEREVFAQTAFRYAEPVLVWRTRKGVGVECKPGKWMELIAAWSVLKLSYRAEKKVFMHAFFQRNSLFSERTKDHPEPTPEELERSLRASIMARGMNAAEIHKQLSSPSQV